MKLHFKVAPVTRVAEIAYHLVLDVSPKHGCQEVFTVFPKQKIQRYLLPDLERLVGLCLQKGEKCLISGEDVFFFADRPDQVTCAFKHTMKHLLPLLNTLFRRKALLLVENLLPCHDVAG